MELHVTELVTEELVVVDEFVKGNVVVGKLVVDTIIGCSVVNSSWELKYFIMSILRLDIKLIRVFKRKRVRLAISITVEERFAVVEIRNN